VVSITVTVSITVSITVPAPITIVIVVIEAARAADAVVANPATYALDLLDDARLVLRQSSTGEADRIRAVGQQRRAQYGGGGQGDKQKLVHLRASRLSAVRAWRSPTKFQSWTSSTTIDVIERSDDRPDLSLRRTNSSSDEFHD
jgi:hypothetical protein